MAHAVENNLMIIYAAYCHNSKKHHFPQSLSISTVFSPFTKTGTCCPFYPQLAIIPISAFNMNTMAFYSIVCFWKKVSILLCSASFKFTISNSLCKSNCPCQGTFRFPPLTDFSLTFLTLHFWLPLLALPFLFKLHILKFCLSKDCRIQQINILSDKSNHLLIIYIFPEESQPRLHDTVCRHVSNFCLYSVS